MHGSKSEYGFRRPTFSFSRPTDLLGTIREETRENVRLIDNFDGIPKKSRKSSKSIPKKSATFHGLQDLRKCSESFLFGRMGTGTSGYLDIRTDRNLKKNMVVRRHQESGNCILIILILDWFKGAYRTSEKGDSNKFPSRI
ncbi:unnamed protein product [Caenorhabditis brenneri]